MRHRSPHGAGGFVSPYLHNILPVAFLVLTAYSGQAQPSVELVERTALGGRVALLTPANFGPMNEQMLKLKYPSERRPTEVLTDERGAINIAFNYTQNAMTPAQVAEAHGAVDRMFRNLYPSARWNYSGVVTRAGRSYIVLDLWTPAIDTEVRNIILGTPVEGRLLLISFNVARELEPQWGAIGERIMDSVRVRD